MADRERIDASGTLDVAGSGPTDDVGRTVDVGRALKIEYFSLAYNVFEAVVGLVAGAAASSVALIGFGLDSVVEASSAAIIVWRLRSEQRDATTTEDAERKAVRMVAVAFFALAAYVGGQAIFDLIGESRPEESTVGIGLAALSLVVMPLLAARKRSLARKLDSLALDADSRQTSLCTYLSAVLLVGLVANTAFGWWWADPVAALGIAALALAEGRELWTAEEVCC